MNPSKIKTATRALRLLIVLACFGNVAFSQIDSGNLFLQGAYLEYGFQHNGAAGASAVVPSGYHPHLGGVTATLCSNTSASFLGSVYDYGHDGWTTGTPAYMGDYSLMGSPQEYWAIEVNGSTGLASAISCGFTGTLTGSFTSYSNSGGSSRGIWSGTTASGALAIRKEYRIDTLSSAMVVTVTLKNTGSSTLNNIYYMRGVDPDNNESWAGTFNTANIIDYQNDAHHRSMVRAVSIGTDSVSGVPRTSMCLGAKDCRAKVLVYANWYTPCTNLDSIWAGTASTCLGTTLYTAGSHDSMDYAIGVVFNIGSIAPSDSTVFAYAYIYDGNDSSSAVDQAFPDPQLIVNRVDSFDTSGVVRNCDFGSAATFPAVINHGNTANWATSTWTWAPATGLSATTGTNVTINRASFTSAVTYTITGYDTTSDACAFTIRTFYLTVQPMLVLGAISGASSMCAGSSIALTDTSTGGTWSSSNTAIATVNSAGRVYGVSIGVDTIYYTKTTACGPVSVSKIVSVTSGVTAGTITGPDRLCVGATGTYVDSTTGGVWSVALTSLATVNSSGVVTAIAAGTDTVKYTVTGCGSTVARHVIVITALPYIATITGATTVCVGATISLADSTSGTWSSSNSSVATIGSTGVVTGVATGTAVMSLSVTNSCGTSVATRTVTVATHPAAPGAISGTTTICVGGSSTLNDGTTGGSWSSSNTSVATINASGSVTGVAAGTATITYTVSNSCGSNYITTTVTVNPGPATPAAISGPSTVCTGSTITLTEGTSGGTWSSFNASIASVSSGGVVTGVSNGTVTISYTVTNTCGSASAIFSITVNSAGSVSAITGTATVCTGANTSLSDVTTGGTWSSSNTSVATVTSGGVVHGIAAGAAIITYTVSGSCGTVYATDAVNVITVPSVAAIGGVSSVCTGATGALTDATTGGTWSSVTPSIANVNTSGVVTGVSNGTVTISYTLTNTCGSAAATRSITVSGTPSAGSIAGTTTVCTGATSTLTDGTAGGVWTSSNASVASVSSTGVVTGISSGTSVISYTVTSACGTAVATTIVTVNPAPAAGTLSGAGTICTGATTTLTSSVSGGTWTSSAATIASVGSTGSVTGVLAGTATISYSVTNSCGTATATRSITVAATPTVGTITGTSTVCIVGATTLTDASSGGTWSSANTAIATVNSAGVVTGNAAGTTSISYTITNTCGSATAGFVINVSPAPSAGSITGGSGVCIGGTVTLSDAVTGGTWSSSNTSLATVTSAGVVRGVAAGTVTISYAVTTACGTAVATTSLAVSTSASAGTISGLSAVCTGATIALTTSGTAGGTWSSSNAAIASVGGGTVHGVSAGTVTISYAVASSCGTVVSTKTVTVTTTPSVTAISGAASICAGSTSTYTDGTSGGGWISSSTAIATVNSSGVVTGVSSGTITLTYFVTNTCGTSTATKSVTVTTLSAGVISGTSSIAVGSSSTLTNTVSGGTWSSSNTSLATITTGGLVTGVAVGTDSIRYTVTNVCGTATASKLLSITAHRGAPVSIPTTEGDFNLYPNPNNGLFTIELPCQQCNAIAIALDLNGKILDAKTTDDKFMYFDLSGYAAGTYVVKVNADGKEYVRKVVVR